MDIETALTGLSQEKKVEVIQAVDQAYRMGTADITGFSYQQKKAFQLALAKKSNGSLYGYQRRRLAGNSDY